MPSVRITPKRRSADEHNTKQNLQPKRGTHTQEGSHTHTHTQTGLWPLVLSLSPVTTPVPCNFTPD